MTQAITSAPCAGSAQRAFQQVTPAQIGRVVSRSSPHYCEGRWEAPEYALAAAVVAHWFSEIQALAKEQLKTLGQLHWSPRVRPLVVYERASVEGWARILGLNSAWIDSMLKSLDLIFPAPAMTAVAQEAEVLAA